MPAQEIAAGCDELARDLFLRSGMASSHPDCRNINDRLVSRGLTELTAALAVGRYRIGAALGIAIQNYIRVRRLRAAPEADYTPSV
jgi:hypothetical protein